MNYSKRPDLFVLLETQRQARGVSVVFTSAASSTSSSYTATATGGVGQTLELFLNGVSQGNMTESPAGTHPKDVTLDELSNDLVIGSDVASLTVAFELDTVAYGVEAWLFTEDNASQSVAGLNGNSLLRGGSLSVASNDGSLSGEGWAGAVDDFLRNQSLGISTLTKYSITLLVKLNSLGTRFLASSGNAENLEMHSKDDGSVRFIPTTGVYLDTPTSIFNTTDEFFISFCYDPSTSYAKCLINGSEVALTNAGANPLSSALSVGTNTFSFWRRESQVAGSFYADGVLSYALLGNSEVEISEMGDHQAWLKAHAKANKPTLYASLP